MTKHTLFITATDTNVGKTLISGLLLEFLVAHSIIAGYQKWFSTGDADIPTDLEECMKIAGIKHKEDIDHQAPYRFSTPASPHLAAEIDNISVDPKTILRSHSVMKKKYDVLIVEGVGGIMVPVRRDLLLADLLAQLQLPTVIVARSGLGTLNHTLLTIEALRSRAIPIVGIIFTDSADENEVIAADNIRTISESGEVEILGRLPHRLEHHDLVRGFQPIGNKLLPFFKS